MTIQWHYRLGILFLGANFLSSGPIFCQTGSKAVLSADQLRLSEVVKQEQALKKSGKVQEAIQLLESNVSNFPTSATALDKTSLYIELCKLTQLHNQPQKSKKYEMDAKDLFQSATRDLVDSEPDKGLIHSIADLSRRVFDQSTAPSLELLCRSYDHDWEIHNVAQEDNKDREAIGAPAPDLSHHGLSQQINKVFDHIPKSINGSDGGILNLPTLAGETDEQRSKRPESQRLYEAALKSHFINVREDGNLSDEGPVHSTPVQIDQIFADVETTYACWHHADPIRAKRDILIYVHGGLVSESDAIASGLDHLDWWHRNYIYPIYIDWHTDIDEFRMEHPSTTLPTVPPWILDAVSPYIRDEHIEFLARLLCTDKWDWMKRKAQSACAKIGAITWKDPHDLPKSMKAGSVLLSRISAYLLEHPDARVHFVGHSAGAIYCAALLEAAEREHVTPSTVTFLAPAIKITDFQKLVVPHLATLKRFTVFDLSDQRELRDRSCKFRTIMYHKSLLYLVSKAIEQPVQDEPQAKDLPGDVALLGLEKFKDVPMTISSDSAFDIITRHGGNMYFAPSAAPLGGQTDACAHGDFAKDVATMDSIARIVTGRNDIFPYWKAPSASPSSSGVAK